MWTTLVLMSALSSAPAQGGNLAINNVRATYGFLGSERRDNKVVPGDLYFVVFDIDGLELDKDGRFAYQISMRIKSPKGTYDFEDKGQKRLVYNVLGGNRLPGFAQAEVGLDAPKGKYELEVTVTDHNKSPAVSKTFTREYEVLDKVFGIIQVQSRLELNMPGGPPPPSPSVCAIGGIPILLNFTIINFKRGAGSKDPSVTYELEIFDDKGAMTLPKKIEEELKDVPEKLDYAPLSFPINLNRVGTFTVKIKTTCKVSNKSDNVEFKIKVVDNKP